MPTQTQGSSAQPFQFTGEQRDGNGLIYLRARYDDPTAGRFLSRDTAIGTIARPQSLNRYGYVQNNPVAYTDPSGRCIGPLLAVCAAVELAADAGVGIEGIAIAGTAATVIASGISKILSDSYIQSKIQAAVTQPSETWTVVVTWPSNLPKTGTRRYVPPKSAHGGAEKTRRGSFVDRWGNEWQWDPVKREWDVQHRDGTHTNVGPNGEITHGKDNFPNKPPADQDQ